MSSINSPEAETDLVFDGRGSEGAANFIRDVRKRAFAEGKLRDDEWMIDFVITCLDGDALRWHLELPLDVRKDWVALQMAFLNQYPGLQDVGGIGEPASAPPAYDHSNTPSSVARTGWIKVLIEDPPIEGYVSRREDHDLKYFRMCPTVADALVVRFRQEARPHEMIPLNAPSHGNYLAISWHPSSASGRSFLALASEKDEVLKGRAGNGDIHKQATVWTLASDDSLEVIRDQTSIPSLPLVPCLSNGIICFVANYAYYLKTNPRTHKIRLVFEPLT